MSMYELEIWIGQDNVDRDRNISVLNTTVFTFNYFIADHMCHITRFLSDDVILEADLQPGPTELCTAVLYLQVAFWWAHCLPLNGTLPGNGWFINI